MAARRSASSLAQIAIMMLSLALATALALLFRSAGISDTSIVLLYLLSVVIASVMTGRVMGIAASVIAVVLFNFFFTDPRFTFVVNDPQYLITFPVMLTVAGISSELTARIRRQAEEAEQRERVTKQLYESSRSLLGAQGQADVIRAAVRHLSGLIGRPVCCAVGGENGEPVFVDSGCPNVRERLVVAVHELLGRAAAAKTTSLRVDESTWVLAPVRAQEQVLAVIIVQPEDDYLSSVATESLRAVVVQLALALDREEMSRREENARIETERERLRANLLQSISHDLRSPLAAIVGSASTVMEEARLSAEIRLDLVKSIRDDARWLTAMVENLLSLTRAEENAVRFRGTVEVLDDVLSSALGRIERIHETHRVEVDPGTNPVLVRMDAGLIEQLVLNLLRNAIQHTPAGTLVRLAIRVEDATAVLTVKDDGPGLSERALEHAFERFYTERSVPDARRGMGLGLSICHSIAVAHGGSITASNAAEGGARFEVRLPVAISVPADATVDEGE